MTRARRDGGRIWARIGRLAVVVAFVALVAIGSGAATELGGRPQAAKSDARVELAPPGLFRNLRVCAATAFSRLQHRCTTDQRTTPIVSNRISCSVDVVVRRTAVVEGRIYYRGALVRTIEPTILRPGTYPAWIFENIKIDQPLPGGAWRCEFNLGIARTSLGFTSGGPLGDVVHVAVCSRDSTVRHESSKLTVCSKDESVMSLLPASEPVYCSATIAGSKGKVAMLEILRGDVSRARVNLAVGSTIWLGTVLLRPSPSSALRPGSFVCRFSLDGQVVAEKPFIVTR